MDRSPSPTSSSRPTLEVQTPGKPAVEFTPEESEILIRASMMYIKHASVGLWIGSLVGCAIPFRKRWAGVLARQSATASKAAGEVKKKAYYPSIGASAGAASNEAADPMKEKLVLFWKASGLALLGGMVGAQIGTVTGAQAVNRYLEQQGGPLKERLLLLKDDFAKSRSDGPNRPTLRMHQANRKQAQKGDAEREELGLGSDQSSTDLTSSPADSPVETVSRWDELRKSRASPPSSWDKLRESSGRASIPSSTNANTNPERFEAQSDEDLRSTAITDDEAATDKEKRRREFDALLESERQGGGERDSKWRRS